MIRKLTFGALVAGAALLGTVAHAGAHLLGFTGPTAPVAAVGDHAGSFSEPGPYRVGVRIDEVEATHLEMSVWYPALPDETDPPRSTYAYGMAALGPGTAVALATYRGAAVPHATPARSAGPHPLVIVSHGFALGAGSHAWLAEHLASHGMVVVAPHHREPLDPDELWRSTVTRPRDILSALAHVDARTASGGALEGLVDTDAIAVIGHSYGGYTALAVAGGRIDGAEFTSACETTRRTDGRLTFLCDALLPRWAEMAALAGVGPGTGLWPAWSDPRVDAVVSMAGDAAVFGPRGLAGVTVPVMAIGGTEDSDTPFEWGARYAYEHAGSDRKIEIGLDGAGHMIFAGECESTRRILTIAPVGLCSDLAWDREDARDLVRHYVTAFVVAELTSDDRAAAELAPGDRTKQGWSYRAKGY